MIMSWPRQLSPRQGSKEGSFITSHAKQLRADLVSVNVKLFSLKATSIKALNENDNLKFLLFLIVKKAIFN